MKKDWKTPTMTQLSVSETAGQAKDGGGTEVKRCPNGARYSPKARLLTCS